jgi:hypothetical protein
LRPHACAREPSRNNARWCIPFPFISDWQTGNRQHKTPDHLINKQEHCVEIAGYIAKHKDQIIIGLLLIYVVVLGFGVIGELFKIEWILNFPLFRL